MDLHTAVAASMLPASRSPVAAALKEIRLAGAGGPVLPTILGAVRFAGAHEPAIAAARLAADEALRAGREKGIEPIAIFDPRYPALLACTPDPPPVLWALGDAAVLSRPAVAVVGSRAATAYALEVGARLAGELAGRGLLVVSGLARGVDSAAHRGSLEAGGATIAVLGSGVDRIYPPEHDLLALTISKSGVLVSELGPGAPPLPEHFPLRNRIISGISLAVVVVEASEKSGSLITARCALEQGRDVMAVPGSVLSGRNRGSHSLLKDGAKVVETADDILEELGWPASRPAPDVSPKLLSRDPLLAPVLDRMAPGEAYALEELAELTGVNGARLLPRLMELELQGAVASAGGRFHRRLTRSPGYGVR